MIIFKFISIVKMIIFKFISIGFKVRVFKILF